MTELFKRLISQHSPNIWKPDKSLIPQVKETWFTENKLENEFFSNYFSPLITNEETQKKIIHSYSVQVYPTNEQKEILSSWFESNRKMYNSTIAKIKEIYKKEKIWILDWKKLRTEYLKPKKAEIVLESRVFNLERKSGKITRKTIPVNLLSNTTKHACSAFKSAISNNHHFKIRYRRKNCKSSVMELEKSYFNKDNLFGNLIYKRDRKLFSIKEIKKNSFLKKEGDIYTLFVPESVERNKIPNRKKSVALDPGIRTFMTSYSQNEVSEFGKECSLKLKEKLERIDFINQNKIRNKKKKLKIQRRKIKHLVDEMHWKTINSLTKNYDSIFLGNLSGKKIISNDTSKLNDMTKRISSSLKFYQFSLRLAFKCQERENSFSLIDESYTSKTCSFCGEINDKLGALKVFDCKNCNSIIDRDINGARNIYIKSYDQKFHVK